MAEHSPHLALVDLMLPDCVGTEVMGGIRPRRDTVVVLDCTWAQHRPLPRAATSRPGRDAKGGLLLGSTLRIA